MGGRGSMRLGDRKIEKRVFANLDPIFQQFNAAAFKALIDHQRSERVNRTLLELIQKEKEPCFLLAAVLEFVQRVDHAGILHHYTFTSFELWLNQMSGLSFIENFHIRAKIVGKRIERNDYQAFFPIGMEKIYEGSHFVTAHRSPDLDTTISSFWGWMDAFGARVSDALHLWNLPGGPPASQIEIQWIFSDLFGEAVFTHLAKTRTALTLTGNDLMTQQGIVQKQLSDSMAGIEHNPEQVSILIVDEEGFYLDDWRHFDGERIRQVILLLSSCLRWFENHLHLHLISLFAKDPLQFDAIQPSLMQLFQMKLSECEPAIEFTQQQKQGVVDFITKVLGEKQGLDASFEQLGLRLAKLGHVPFVGADTLIASMRGLFDGQGMLQERRPHIFSFLERTVRALHEAILAVRMRLEKLDIALKTKKEVFGIHPTFVTVRSDVEEIRQKLGSQLSLTVVYPDQSKLFPMGIIQARDLRKRLLGTVSLRDFCNREEMTIPPYLEVISMIDHHKSELNTFSPPMAIIADVQSSNTLVASLAFEINDRYSLGGQTEHAIE